MSVFISEAGVFPSVLDLKYSLVALSGTVTVTSSAHGLRHHYAGNEFDKLAMGYRPKEAERETTERLGHGRPEAT